MKDVVRIGVVGLGARGLEAVARLPGVPSAQVAALCDPTAKDARKIPNCAFFFGDEGYKALCQMPLDLIYVATDWAHHVPVALEAMACGKAVAIEVPAALTLEDCFALVEASEKSSRPCVQLENCIYGEIEMLAENLARQGVLGEVVHCENSYIHRLFGPGSTPQEPWRIAWNLSHRGNQYVTHALGPLARIMGIGSGDEMDFLVSLECDAMDFKAFAREQGFEAGPDAMGDHNTTAIRTKKGRTILLRHDVASVRPRTRSLHVQGEKGVLTDEPFRIAIEPVRDAAKLPEIYEIPWLEPEERERMRTDFMHPLWREHGDKIRTADKHGGMDYLMDLRLIEAVRTGSKPDTDVYDLAEWCSIAELSERSVRNRSAPVQIPRFRPAARAGNQESGI